VNYNGKPMPRAYIMSPLRADTAQGTTLNIAYAKLAMLLSMVVQHESPYVPLLLLTQVILDSVPAQRALGMAAGKRWISVRDRGLVQTSACRTAWETEIMARREIDRHRRIFPPTAPDADRDPAHDRHVVGADRMIPDVIPNQPYVRVGYCDGYFYVESVVGEEVYARLSDISRAHYVHMPRYALETYAAAVKAHEAFQFMLGKMDNERERQVDLAIAASRG
jgi:hypothetical protein